jgi:hypothetical protein
MSSSIHSPGRTTGSLAIIGVLLALLASLLGGCSTAKLGYNNAPSLLYWWFDSYLDFNDLQTPRVRADLAQWHTRHRETELPAYAGTLAQWQRAAATNMSGEQVCALVDDVRLRFSVLLDQAEPALLTLAPTLTTEQLAHLERQFDKRNQKWREEWLDGTPTERQSRRLKQLTDRAETLYGRLEDAQRAVISASLASSLFDASRTYGETLRRQQDMLQTLRLIQSNGLSDIQQQAELRALLVRIQTSPNAAYRAHRDQVTRVNCQSFADLHNSTTPAQRLKAVAVLKGYEDDARTLMGNRTRP